MADPIKATPFRCMMLEGLLFTQFANAAAAAMTQKHHMDQIRKMKEEAERNASVARQREQEQAFNKEELLRRAKQAAEASEAGSAALQSMLPPLPPAFGAGANGLAEVSSQGFLDWSSVVAPSPPASSSSSHAPPPPPPEDASSLPGGAAAVVPSDASRAAAVEAHPPAAETGGCSASSTSGGQAAGEEEPPPAAGGAKANLSEVETVLGRAQQAAKVAAEVKLTLPAMQAPARPAAFEDVVRERRRDRDGLDRRRSPERRSSSRPRRAAPVPGSESPGRRESRKGRSGSQERRSRSRDRRGRGRDAGALSPPRRRERSGDRKAPSSSAHVITGATVERRRRVQGGGGWDSQAATEVPVQAPPSRPPMVGSGRNHKVLRLPAIQIRALLGRGGQTINDIRSRSGADIKIHHPPQDEFGSISIVGNIDLVESLMTDALAMKGCAMLPGTMGTAPKEPGEDEVAIPGHLVATFIGPSGAGISAIKAMVAGAVFISVQPPLAPGGAQKIQVAGSGRREAVALIRSKIEELSRASMAQGRGLKGTGRAAGFS
eukprot:TRINITY_DN48202_c0_g1_i1.p1 TRINITY_DN48202_c0_g1~~TRINITY_DN48202_c0_g1_i1.p1  ORF type:complete len:565 (+),score=127.06 TRINITY_DN48202_c0_g1_i1:54-1697(+)